MLSEPLVFSAYPDDSTIDIFVVEFEKLGLSDDENNSGMNLDENDLVGGAGGGSSSDQSISSGIAIFSFSSTGIGFDLNFDIGLKLTSFPCDDNGGAFFVSTLFATVEMSIAIESFRVVCDITDIELRRVDCDAICSLLKICFSVETSYVSPHAIAVLSFVKNSLF